MLRSACIENRRVPRDQIVAARFSILDHYPPVIAWFDCDSAARFEIPVDRTLELDDLDSCDFGLEPVCGKCFRDWLRSNGVDTSRSREEKRFTHLADQLRDLAWPTLQPAFDAVGDAVRQAVDPAFVQCVRSLGRTKEAPLLALLRFILSGDLSDDSDLTVYAACHDRQTFLQCECEILFKHPGRPALEGPHIDIPIDADGLGEAGDDGISEWTTRVAAFVTAHRQSVVEEVLAARRRPAER
jgi:hypothetical protein